MTAERATCPLCGGLYLLTSGGLLRRHGRRRARGGTVRCPGSARPPQGRGPLAWWSIDCEEMGVEGERLPAGSAREAAAWWVELAGIEADAVVRVLVRGPGDSIDRLELSARVVWSARRWVAGSGAGP